MSKKKAPVKPRTPKFASSTYKNLCNNCVKHRKNCKCDLCSIKATWTKEDESNALNIEKAKRSAKRSDWRTFTTNQTIESAVDNHDGTATLQVVESKDTCGDMKRFDTGTVRGTDCADVRYDLISPIGLRRIAEAYAEGSCKYGDSNWQKGIPTRDLLNHALNHLQQWQIGDKSEDHLAHAAWNIITMMHAEERMPQLVSRPYEPGFDPSTDPTNK